MGGFTKKSSLKKVLFAEKPHFTISGAMRVTRADLDFKNFKKGTNQSKWREHVVIFFMG